MGHKFHDAILMLVRNVFPANIVRAIAWADHNFYMNKHLVFIINDIVTPALFFKATVCSIPCADVEHFMLFVQSLEQDELRFWVEDHIDKDCSLGNLDARHCKFNFELVVF